MYAIFFYGITFVTDQCRHKILIKELESHQPTEEDKQMEGFNEDKWYEMWVKEGYFYEIIWKLDEKWEKEGDPIRIGHMRADYQEPIYYLGIRDTFHSSVGSFILEKAEKDEWQRLLKEKADTYGIRWKSPKFHLMAAYE